jgi:outer membrane protein assembly factor BamB
VQLKLFCFSPWGTLYTIFRLKGSYDKHLYTLAIQDGSVHWKFQASDVIKSSPCIDLIQTGYVYFGAHDKHIYCLDIEERKLIWKVNADNSSIFAGPVCEMNHVYASTLGGRLFCLCKNSGEIRWTRELGKPTFTSPIVAWRRRRVFIGTCGGDFHAIDAETGKQEWTFGVEKPIFSNACLADDCVLFGCHDGCLYCVDQSQGRLVWKLNLEKEIYSTPFKLEPEPYVVAVSCDGRLNLIHLNGTQLVRADVNLFEQKNSCYSSPIVHENRLFIGSRDNFLYSFKFIEKK